MNTLLTILLYLSHMSEYLRLTDVEAHHSLAQTWLQVSVPLVPAVWSQQGFFAAAATSE